MRRSFLLVFALTAPAHADHLTVTPYLHSNFGDVEIRRGGWGVALGYLGRRVGFELDVDRHHHYYKDDEIDSVPNVCIPGAMAPCIDSDTDAWVFMGNVIGVIPVAQATRWKLTGAAGAGFIHAWIHDAGEYNSDQTHAAFDLGGTATYWLRDWLGFRVDARWYHVFVDEDSYDGGYTSDYDFARISLGVTFGLGL